jgi:hypothetical protein
VQNALAAEQAAVDSGAAGLLLDLDFRRLAPSELVGEAGPVNHKPTAAESAQWAAAQGILILQYLRRRGITLPALLFADLDDPAQASFLEQTLAPLSVVGSREGLGALAARLHILASGR